MSWLRPAPDPIPVTLARIETKLDQAIKSSEDHETRIRDLEAHDLSALRETVAEVSAAVAGLQRWRWIVTGAAAAAGGGAGAVGAVVQHLLTT